MKIRKLFPDKKTKGYEELKLSLLIHIAILLALSAFFAWRQAHASPVKKKIVPVRLVAPVSKPKTGSGKKVKKKAASKKAKGKSSKRSKSSRKKVAKKKKVIKKVVKAKVVKKKTTKINKAKKVSKVAKIVKKKTMLKPEGTKKTPTVVQNKEPKITKVVPTHVSPTFESISRLSMERSASSLISDETPGEQMEKQSISEMPSLSPSDFSEEMQSKFMPKPSGLPTNKASDNSGAFQVGAIEAFGGTNDNFTPPSIISKKLPDYPSWAREKGVRGQAVYRVLIQEAGTVGDVVTMNSTIDPKLAINGAQALRRWLFTPVLQNGEPKETWVKVTVKYSLN